MPSPADLLGALADRPLLAAGDDDRYFDMFLQPYEPRCSPAGKLRSENLLWLSADLAGAPPAFEEALHTIQRGAGRDLTVFGVKHGGGRLWWELYFYDVDRRQGALRSSELPALMRPHIAFDVAPRETLPYFMFSVDVHPDLHAVNAINYYLRYYGVGGRSYKLTAEGVEFENVYRFYEPGRELPEMLRDIKTSAHVDYGRVPLSHALLPELYACRRICVAKKRHADGMYYSGIDVDQFAFFLRRFGWPAGVTGFVKGERDRLDHLRFDVGVDLAMDEEGQLSSVKTSCYGTL
jgi:hypothetical protein